MTKYAIRHKKTGEYFHIRLGGVDYYRPHPPVDAKDLHDSMTEAVLVIVSMNAESYLEGHPVNVTP